MKTNWKKHYDNENYFHIYNRGVDKRDVFLDWKDYARFIRSIRYFNRLNPVGSLYDYEKILERSCSTSFRDVEQLVELICYCLNPNHYHFLLKQKVDGGITEFMKRIGGGYTKYFNTRYQRSGSLFQGRYKVAGIKSTEHLLDISVYVNGNPRVHGIVEDLNSHPWSSYLDYIKMRSGTMCNKEIIMNEFENVYEYKKYFDKTIEDIIQYRKEQKEWLE